MQAHGRFRSQADGRVWIEEMAATLKRLEAKHPVSLKAVFDNGHLTILLS
jgi:hypothetical protein